MYVINIRIEGNKKTKGRIIERELTFSADSYYTRNELDSLFEWDRNRIYNTNLFNTVDFSLVEQRGDSVTVLLTVEERWYFYPIPFLRLIDRNISDWWVNRDRDLSRINYGIRLSQFNFRGRNELLRVVLQSGFTSGYGLFYNIPNLDKKQNHGLLLRSSFSRARNVAFNTVENIPRFTFDSEEVLRRSFTNIVRHSYRSSLYSFHTTTLAHTYVEIADTLANLNPNFLGEQRTKQGHFYFGHAFRYDKRDNVNYTLEGTRFFVGFFKHGLGIHRDGVNYWRGRVSGAKHWNLKNNLYAASDFSILTTFPRRRDYFNYFRIGVIPETLRGFDLTVVEGSSYAIQRNELKYRLFKRNFKFLPIDQFRDFPISVFWKVYYDHGYAQGFPNYTGSEPLQNNYLNSIGTGLDLLLIYDFTLRLELSRNSQKNTFFFINFLALI